jgi:hypothetical protein
MKYEMVDTGECYDVLADGSTVATLYYRNGVFPKTLANHYAQMLKRSLEVSEAIAKYKIQPIDLELMS